MTLKVAVVSPTQKVWSGEASFISARTTEGDLGVLPGHAPLFGVLVDGAVSIKVSDGTTQEFNVHGGFLSVSNDRVSILTESVGEFSLFKNPGRNIYRDFFLLKIREFKVRELHRRRVRVIVEQSLGIRDQCDNHLRQKLCHRLPNQPKPGLHQLEYQLPRQVR